MVLILDELERGIVSIRDPARQNQNLSFLQMLSEEANRDRRITLFAAVYDGNREPGSTLKRTPRIELRFRNAGDRAAIVRHRLFSNANTYDRDAARTVVRSYVNTWRKFGVATQDPYVETDGACLSVSPRPCRADLRAHHGKRPAFKARAAPWDCSGRCLTRWTVAVR